MQVSPRDRLQRCVWQNDTEKLTALLDNPEQLAKNEINSHDLRGNTPLVLAIMLGRHECIRILLEHGASCNTKSKLGWQPIHEARSFGDREMIKTILRFRRTQMETYLKIRSERTIERLKELDDFSLEMKWDFSSWIPFVSRFCPSDVYKFYKKGSFVRVDTTLKGFDKLKWVRGNISFIYQVTPGEMGNLYILDHDRKVFEKVKSEDREEKLEERVNIYMNTKIHFGEFNHNSIKFERAKSGAFGLGSGKTEMVGPYEADIYTMTGIKIKQMVRSENMIKMKGEKTEVDKVEELLEDAEGKEEEVLDKVHKFEAGKKDSDLQKMIDDAKLRVLKFKESLPPPPPPSISFEEYFDPDLQGEKLKRSSSSSLSLSSISSSLGFGKDTTSEDGYEQLFVGRDVSLKVTKRELKASVWMSTSFPLFVEQLLPIIEILAPSNRHFETLRDFIDVKLPRGFPTKIEIPLFGVLTAKVTFQNYVPQPVMEDNLFQVPADYTEGEVKMEGGY